MYFTNCGIELDASWNFCAKCGAKVETIEHPESDKHDLAKYGIEKRDFRGFDTDLFEKLRRLRREIADAENVHPYFVFDDKALKEIVLSKPCDYQELLDVRGVGEHKLDKYGEAFLEEIIKHLKQIGEFNEKK